MDQLHDQIDKLFTEIDHFDRVVGRDGDDIEGRVDLALAVAKRVRSQSTLVVRALARLRDQLQPGGTSEHDHHHH